MLKQPRLKYSYFAHFMDEEKIVLTSEKENVLLSGRPYRLLLEALQAGPQGMSTEQLVTALENQLSFFEVGYLLEVLEKKGYLTEASPSLSPDAGAYWNSQGLDVNRLEAVLSEQSIVLEAVAGPVPEIFPETFAAAGIRCAEVGRLKVVIADEYQHKELSRFNREALAARQPWMLIKPAGTVWWLGPIFIPGQTGCWECLNQRLGINNPINMFYKIQANSEDNLPIPLGFVPASMQIVAGQAALEVIKWLYHGTHERLEGSIISFDTQTMESTTHVLVKRPQCPACGTPLDRRRTPDPIVPVKKSRYCVGTAGGYRECSPEDTLEQFQHHISPITGVVRALKSYHGVKGSPIYNYSSGPNTALRSKTLFWLNSHIRSTNGGKGKTSAQAKAGALCEAIERYCMTYQGDEPRISSSLEQLGDMGIHPNGCMNYSRAQYRDREALNRACSKFFALVPVPFDPKQALDWTPVYSLSEHRFKYLPTAFCYTQYPASDESALFSYPDSNGSAAGNTLEEAILQGFLELVERDSVALWWYNRIPRPGVDLSGFDDPYFQRLEDYYETLGRRLYVLDLTSDLRIPAFAAVSYRRGQEKENIMFGFGAHVDAKIAIERALVELNQLLPVAQAPGTDWKQGRYLTQDKIFVDWLNNATLANQPYFVPETPLKNIARYPSLCGQDVYSALTFCLDRAKEAGLETLVLDMTRKDVGLPVARVFVPGLRHFWKRLAPGRLYDVPVQLGLRKTPMTEEDVNPIGLFI